MRWCFVYHDPAPTSEAWTLPRGFAAALRAEGVELWTSAFTDPSHVALPSCEELQRRQISVLLVFYAGRSEALERELLRIRQGTELLIVNELGDEPQTRQLNAVRVQLSDLCLSPDAASVAHWQALGGHCLWFTHWADTALFHPQDPLSEERSIFLVTTMGRRRYHRLLRLVLGGRYQNRRCAGEENPRLYGSGRVAFQYARWGEVTRRVFEAAACGCCVLTNALPERTGLAQLLPPDRAAVYYSGPCTLLTQLWRLARQPQWARHVAAEGQKRVLADHTQQSRARQLLNFVQTCPARMQKGSSG
jgi:hypothetical protein